MSNHLANNPRTAGILNYPLFSPHARKRRLHQYRAGAQVVEADLVRALTEQPGRTALLDVTSPEPPEAGHPFYRLPNVWLSPISQAAPGMKWNVCPATCSRNSDACGKGSPPYTK